MKKMIGILTAMLMLFHVQPVFAGQPITLVIGDKTVGNFSVVNDRIYVPDEVLAGFIGIGPNHCDCGSTALQRGGRSITFDANGIGISSTGSAIEQSAIRSQSAISYPLRAVCEYFNYGVSWDESARTCTISMKERLVTSADQSYDLILDVRSAEEYDQGHIDKAVNIPVGELLSRLQELDTFRDADILVYCKGGKRSAQAVGYLVENGFTRISHLYKGYDSLPK